MKVLVLGATGGTGRHVTSQLLEAGHTVSALVRTPEKLSISSDRLHLTIGSVTDAAVMANVFGGQDAAISTLGCSGLKANRLLELAIPLIVSGMQEAGVRRLIFTSAIGVGAAYADAPLFSKFLINLLLKDLYADKVIAENAIKASACDWTIVQPAQLTNGQLTGRYRHGIDLAETGVPRISRADVADFLVKQLTDRRYIGKIVRIAY